MLEKTAVKLTSLGLLLLAFAAPGQAQAKAKTTTPKTTNAVLKLNYKTYVYNKKGQRIRWFKGTKGWQKYYKKGTKIKTSRKVKRTTKDVRYYLLYSYDTSDDTNLKKYWLPYKKIKGNYFYSIGHGYYIKARNVDMINNAYQYSNGEKAKVSETDSEISTIIKHEVNKKGKILPQYEITKRERVKTKTVLVIDGVYTIVFPRVDGDDLAMCHIKGTKNKYIVMNYLRSKDWRVFYPDLEAEHYNIRVNLPHFSFISEW